MGENIEKLIEKVRGYPYLYDTSLKEYKNILKKDETWKRIGQELGENGITIKNKWKNVRDSYMKSKKSIKGTTGQAAKKYKKWPWGDHMSFLDHTIASRSTSINIEQEIHEDTHSRPSTNPSDYESTEGSIYELQSVTPPSPSTHQSPPFRLPPSTTKSNLSTPAPSTSKSNLPIQSLDKKRKQGSDDVEKVIGYLENKKKKSYDAIDHLFLSYAETFKTFSKKRQTALKIDLAKFFAEVDLNEFEEQERTRSSSVASNRSNYSQINISFCDESSQSSIQFAEKTTTLNFPNTKTSTSYIASHNSRQTDFHQTALEPNYSTQQPPDDNSMRYSSQTSNDQSFLDLRQAYEKSYQFCPRYKINLP